MTRPTSQHFLAALAAPAAATLAADLRARGFERLLFGSDSPVFDPIRVVDLLAPFAGLTPTEIAMIRANSVPGLFPEGVLAASRSVQTATGPLQVLYDSGPGWLFGDGFETETTAGGSTAVD